MRWQPNIQTARSQSMRRFILTRLKKRFCYKKLGETGEQTEKHLKSEEKVDRDNIGDVSELSNKMESISISEDLQLVSSEENI